jgi:hypothetical protein
VSECPWCPGFRGIPAGHRGPTTTVMFTSNGPGGRGRPLIPPIVQRSVFGLTKSNRESRVGRMRFAPALEWFCVVCLVAPAASAQDRPFVFSLTTTPDTSRSQVLVNIDLGLGESAFQSTQSNGPEQRVGVQASLGRWTLVGRFGVASVNQAYQTSQQGEVLFSVFTQASAGVAVAVGGGMLREAGGTNVMLARVVAGREFQNWRAHGNVLFQKPLAADRDALDLITSVGWARRLSRSVSLGVEGIGEDLEGFWDRAEAEGGARLLVGPSLHIAPPGRRWQLSFAGGPMFHPTNTGRSSGAFRDLPPDTRARSYALRSSFACTF